MQHKAKIAVLISVLLLIVVVLTSNNPSIRSFNYITLVGVDSIEIVKRGKHSESALFFDSSIPLEYVLKRNSYSIHFSVHDYSIYTPSLLVSGKSRRGGALLIRAIPNYAQKSQYGYGCPWGTETYSGEYSIGWHLDCHSENHQVNKIFVFEVLNENGQVIDREKIPFKISSNGYFIHTDSL